MQENIFVRPPSAYSRELDIVSESVRSAAMYLHLQTGDPLEKCTDFVSSFVSKPGVLKPVTLKGLRRKPNGDRTKDITTIDNLLAHVDKTKSILSFNMVVYDNPNDNLSCTAAYVTGKKAERSIIKKRGFKAKADGDKITAAFCSNAEAGIKLLINSLSGAHVSPYNSQFNRTAHSTLTSLCRVATNYSNASTERLLMGNRHYWSSEITLNNIVSVVQNTDYVELQKLVDSVGLHIPSVTEVIMLVKRSTDLYWHDTFGQTQVESLLNKLTPIQRVAFTYTGDLHHLAKFNPVYVKGMIDDVKSETPLLDKDENLDRIVSAATDDTIALVGILCSSLLNGESVSALKQKSAENYLIYVSTIVNVQQQFYKYKDLVKTLLLTDNVPPSVYNFPSSIRRCVVGGDTDSTMFTVQNWIEWYYGDLLLTDDANQVGNILIFLNSQVITHMLALMSKQMGVNDDKVFDFKMKNEYLFPVYMRANRAKHYATLITAREGNVYKEPLLEIKGVALKDSKIPTSIIGGVQTMIENSLLTILSGSKIEIYKDMQIIANMEHDILNSIDNGESKYLSFMTIKERDAYKQPMSSNYMHYDLWKNVFADTFGITEPPPYRVVKLSTKLGSRLDTSKWIQSLDPVMGARLTQWMELNEKEKFGMLLLPHAIFEKGIPDVFISTIDKRRLVSELMQSAYIYMEICGIYMRNRYHTTLLSDTIPYRKI